MTIVFYLSAPDFRGTMDHPAAIFDAGHAVAREEGRTVEVDDVAELANEEGRRHREAGAHHVADHYVEPERLCLPRDREPFGQPAAFIELDIDDVEASDERGGVDARQRAFIVDDGQRPFESVEIGLAPGHPPPFRTARRERLWGKAW